MTHKSGHTQRFCPYVSCNQYRRYRYQRQGIHMLSVLVIAAGLTLIVGVVASSPRQSLAEQLRTHTVY